MHWVDADVLAIINAAHQDAERRGAVEVELLHVLIALTSSSHIADAFEAARIDRRVLLAVVTAEAQRDSGPASASMGLDKPRTSQDVRLLLDLAERTAAIYGARVIGVQDLVATLLACPAVLDGSNALGRWLWAARAYPDAGRIVRVRTSTRTASSLATSSTTTSSSSSVSTEDMTTDTASSIASAEVATAAADTPPLSPSPPAPTDGKVVRLKGRNADAPDDLIDDEPLDAGQEPDPELERLGVKRYYLSLDDEIVRAPSIGPRTAERLQPHGITHVKHLLACDAERLSARLGARHLTTSKILAWKHQARLVCTIPWLRGMHAQLLVGAGYASIEKILQTDRSQVCAAVTQFAMSRDGQSILRGATPPELDRIMRWIENSQQAEPQRAQWGRLANN